jgi:hypothetical protein
MTAYRFLRALAAGAGLALLCGATCAAPIVQRLIHDDPRHSVGARVLASFAAHLAPARDWYVDVLDGRRPDDVQFRGFARQLETATFVSFTYEYVVNGEAHRRVYHARSGHNELQTGLVGERARRPYASYFPRGADVIAWAVAPPRGSSVTSSPVRGDAFEDARKRDAELKVARRIERDIREGLIVGGGRLNGYSSQLPCPSCAAALQELADRHDIRVHVSYLGHGSPAYTRFDRQRHQYLTSIDVAVHGGQLNRLNASADTSAERVAVACLDAPGEGEINDL